MLTRHRISESAACRHRTSPTRKHSGIAPPRPPSRNHSFPYSRAGVRTRPVRVGRTLRSRPFGSDHRHHDIGLIPPKVLLTFIKSPMESCLSLFGGMMMYHPPPHERGSVKLFVSMIVQRQEKIRKELLAAATQLLISQHCTNTP